MKRFNALIVWTVLVGLGLIAVCITYTNYHMNIRMNQQYQIEINRIVQQVNEGTQLSDIVLKPNKPGAVRTLEWMNAGSEPTSIKRFFDGDGLNGREGFAVKPIFVGQELSGYLRFSYLPVRDTDQIIIFEGLILLVGLGGIAGLLFYVKLQILKPFHIIESLPYELSKGHLNVGVKENQSRFFGKFIWGLDLLRETLESQKQTNLSLEKDRQTLVASLSHELKTPVAAIKLYSSALVDEIYESRDKQKDCARLIGQKAERIETLIGEIITASVSSLQNIEVKQEEFYLEAWLKRLLFAHNERLRLLKIDLEIGEFTDKILLGDADKLLEVMDNLIENGIKYGDGGLIRIFFQEEDMRQLIIVENTGIPLASTELPYMFTSFWRGSNSQGKKGNGLGLYICKQVLQKMGGDIYSEVTSQGMRFVLVVKY